MNFSHLKVGDRAGDAEVVKDLSYKLQGTKRADPFEAHNLWLVLRSREATSQPPVYWLVKSAERAEDGYFIIPSNKDGKESTGVRYQCALPWTALEWVGDSFGVELFPPDPVFVDDRPPSKLSRAETFRRCVAEAFSENKLTNVEFELGGPTLVARVYASSKTMLTLLVEPNGQVKMVHPATRSAYTFSGSEEAEAAASIAIATSALVHAGIAAP